MKNLTFASLRGTKTAIHCETAEQRVLVSKICGYNWGDIPHMIKNATHIGLASKSYGTLMGFKGCEIIPAADFIAANSSKPELPTDYVPLFNHLANEHDLTLLDSELMEIALKVPIPENSLLEKIENMKKLIRIGVIVTKPKDRHDDLLTAIGQIEAEAKKVFER